MGNQVSFYLKESFKQINKSKLIILALAIAVSMVAGFGYYFDSAQNFIIKETNPDVFDYCAEFNSNEANSLNFSFSNAEYDVENTFLTSNLQIQNSYFYQVFSNSKLYIYGENNLTDQAETNLITFITPELKFFNSSRFNQYFSIVEGEIPTQSNEILIDSMFAKRFNITIGMNQTLPFLIGSRERELIQVPNLNIVGLYSINYDEVIFGRFSESIEPGSNFIFISTDYRTDSMVLPNEFIIQKMAAHEEFNIDPNYLFVIDTLNSFEFDRDSINIAWLSASASEIDTKFIQFTRRLPNNVISYNFITTILSGQFKFQTIVRLSIQFTNLPLYAFAIYMASVANKSKVKQRYHEFFTMRMRGFPKKMIRNQLITESLVNSIFIAIIGVILGIVIFFLGQYWLNPLFLAEFNRTGFALSFYFSFRTVFEAFIFGVVLNVLATLSTIKYINSLKTSKLASELANIKGDVDYDESTLYYQQEKGSGNKSNILEVENFMKKKEELIPKWGLLLALASLVPISLFLIMILGQNIQTSDTLIEFANVLYDNLNFVIILTLISPFFLVIGLIRFFVQESPPRFARISKRIGRIFMKKRDYFVGIEMVRQKQYTRIIFLAGLYVALILFSNMSTNSLIRQNALKTNLECGSDLNVDFSISGSFFENFSDIETFENQLLDIRNPSDDLIIDSVVRSFYSKTWTGNGLRTTYMLNLSQYLDLMVDDGKLLPSANFQQDIQDVIDYNRALGNQTDRAGVIVSSSLVEMNNFHLGDTFTFLQSSINFSSSTYVRRQITAKIIKIIDVMPGLYFSKSDDPGNFVVVNDHIFSDYSEEIIPSKTLKEMVNFKQFDSSLKNKDQIYQNYFQNSTDYYLLNSNYQFYNYEWQDVDSASFNDSSLPYIGLLYFNLIIIGMVLAVGMAILIISTHDQNRGLYGELLARGFGRKALNRLVLSEMSISFLIATIIGSFAGTFTAIAFAKLFSLSGGGGNLALPIFFNFKEFLYILGGIFGFTFLLLSYSLFMYRKEEISEFLLDME